LSLLPPGYEAHGNEDLGYVHRSGEAEMIQEMGLTDLFTLEDMLAAGPRRGRGRVFEVPPPEETPGRPLVLKQVLHGGLYGRLNRDRFLRCERVLRELRLTAAARERGVPVPEIAFVGWTQRRPRRLFLATDQVPGSRTLEQVILEERRGPRRAAAIRAAAIAVREMHDAGLVHGDLNIRNLMVSEAEGYPEGFVLDLDRSHFPRRLGDSHRTANLARLLRSLEKSPELRRHLSLRDRARFLRDYCRAPRPLSHRRLSGRIAGRARWFRLHRLAWWIGWR